MSGYPTIHPSAVLAEGNTRYGLKPAQIERLAESIAETGGVLEPVLLEAIPDAKKGQPTHRLIAGFYRHAAVTKLNSEQNAGLELPYVLRAPATEIDRIKEQLAENMTRENQSPMDAAVSIRRLLDAGMPKAEVRRVFSRPSAKKGAAMQPASNAWVNIMLSLLDLPKSIQEKIHDGRVGVAAAYELGKVPADRRAAVLARAEAEVKAQYEIEQADENKLLEAEKREAAKTAEAEELKAEVERLRVEGEKAEELAKARADALSAARKQPYLDLDAEGKKALKEQIESADSELKAAQKAKKDAQNALAKALKRQNALVEAKARLAKARAAKKPAKPGTKTVGQADIKNAARAESKGGAVPLTLSEIKIVVKDLRKMKEAPALVKIAEALGGCFEGVTTTKQLAAELLVIVKEAK